jgi:hypothetical protein
VIVSSPLRRYFARKYIPPTNLHAHRGGDYFPSSRVSRITPCCEPSTAATYAFATSAEARPDVGSIPNFTIVSFTHGGLTASTFLNIATSA